MSRLLTATLQLARTNPTGVQALIGRTCSNTTEACKAPPQVRETSGLSANVVKVPNDCVGFPNASKEGVYKNPEYFCYSNTSYFEAEVEMLKYRLPQPSNKAKN